MSVEQVTFNIPSDPGLLLKVKNGLKEIEDSKIKAKAQTDLQTEIFNKLAEETGIPNRALRKLATAQADGGVDKLSREVSDIERLYHAINRPANEIIHQQNVDLAMAPYEPKDPEVIDPE